MLFEEIGTFFSLIDIIFSADILPLYQFSGGLQNISFNQFILGPGQTNSVKEFTKFKVQITKAKLCESICNINCFLGWPCRNVCDVSQKSYRSRCHLDCAGVKQGPCSLLSCRCGIERSSDAEPSARIIGSAAECRQFNSEVVQSQRSPLLEPSPG